MAALLFVQPASRVYNVFHYLRCMAYKSPSSIQGVLGVSGSPWVGWKHFQTFSLHTCAALTNNTLLVKLNNLLWVFPIPILMALLLNRIERPD